MSHAIRVTNIRQVGGIWHLTGVVDERSQLQQGEDPIVELQLDRERGVVLTRLVG
jgi:hypothetical protein